jgi:hypothetical protein
MARRAARLLLLSALAGALAACAADVPTAVDANVFPAKYKDEVIGTLKELFTKNETISVSNAFISAPALRSVASDQRYTICVRYTARGTAYNLTANAERIGYFYGGHLNQLVEAGKDQCGSAAYAPFPELDKVCLGVGCR